MNNIYLIGMPGCGKTGIAKAVSKILLKYTLVDLDRLIELERHSSVTEIFRNDGEAYFRNRETVGLRNLKKASMCIISVGGGAVLSEENRSNMSDGGVVFFIDRPLEMLYKEDHSKRPLLANNPKETLDKMWDEREGLYRECADYVIENNGEKRIKQLAEEIVRLYKEKKNEKSVGNKRS